MPPPLMPSKVFWAKRKTSRRVDYPPQRLVFCPIQLCQKPIANNKQTTSLGFCSWLHKKKNSESLDA